MTNEFYVQESVLDTAATRLDALSAQRAGAESYVDEHLEFGIGDTGLLLATILLTTGSAAQDVRSALASIGQHLDSAAREGDRRRRGPTTGRAACLAGRCASTMADPRGTPLRVRR
jgi:hypothetical protein